MCTDSPSPFEPSNKAASPLFNTTQWSIVLSARETDNPELAAKALESLCQTYWYPVYVYVRRWGHSPEDASDLTQDFFAGFLEKESFHRADQERGKFRTFLLSSVRNFLRNQHDKMQAVKRTIDRTAISVDAVEAEERYRLEPVEGMTPEKHFEKRWVATLLSSVLKTLESEYCKKGEGSVFSELKPHICADPAAVPYRRLAEKLDMTESNLKMIVHRQRKRYRDLLKEEILKTLDQASGLEDELSYLMRLMSA